MDGLRIKSAHHQWLFVCKTHFLCSMNNSLKGLHVVDLSSVLAGPSVGSFLAELGAEVIKIENKKTDGDVTRSWKTPNEPTSAISSYFASANFGKTYRFLDLTQSDHINEVYRLIKNADICISNFKEGDDLKFGLDYGRLKQINPKLIYACISGFDSDSRRVAYDLVVQAECGHMYMNGPADGEATKLPVAMMDILAAHQLKEGILLALYQRARDGLGRQISCSLEAAAISGLANQASAYLMNQQIPQRLGSLHPNIAPYGESFACEDGRMITMAIGSDRQFQDLCALLNIAEIGRDPRYSNNTRRLENRVSLQAVLYESIAKIPSRQLLTSGAKMNIPLALIKNMQEVFENPVAQALIKEEKIADTNTRRVSQIAFKIKL